MKHLPKEMQMQIMVMDWLRMAHPVWHKKYVFHIANERKVSKLVGYWLKRMGVRSGVSDIFIMKPNDTYHGAFLELKMPGKKPSKTQIEFLEDAIECGYMAKVCHGFDHTIKEINDYIFNKS